MRDPFLFTLALSSLAFITVALAITGRLFGDPALIGLAVISTFPAFWLFYQRERVDRRPAGRANDRLRRR